MKPKTLQWINPKEEMHMTTDEIPQVLYRIYKVEPFVFGLFFHHGYSREYEDSLLCKDDSVDTLKKIAQNHWNNYVFTKFMESSDA